ncbi:MAG: hypothetical protein WA667_22250 [Candidatus Nitrosopolaris sp.]
MECEKRVSGIKIHVAVDIKKKKIVSLDVTSEEVYGGKVKYLSFYQHTII